MKNYSQLKKGLYYRMLRESVHGLTMFKYQILRKNPFCNLLNLNNKFGGSVWESKHALRPIYHLITNSYKRQYQSVHVLFTVLILLLP
jgi:hypothetical protein